MELREKKREALVRRVSRAFRGGWTCPLVASFGALVVAGLWATVLVGLDTSQRTTLATELRNTEHFVDSFEENVRHTLAGYDRTLQLLKADLERSGQPDPRRIHEIGVIRGDDVLAINVVGADGRPLASNRNFDDTIDFSDRDYFRRHAAFDAAVMDISVPVVGRLHGRNVVVLSRRLSGRDGTFAGIVMISVNPGQFTDNHYVRHDFGDQGLLAILGTDGRYRAQRTGGGYEGGLPTLDDMLSAPSGGARSNAFISAGRDNEPARLVAWRQVSGYPLMALATRARDEALADYGEHRRVYLALAAAATAVMVPFFGILTWVVYRLRRRTGQLREQQDFLRKMLDNIPVGISVRELNPAGDGRYVLWNETNAVMYGAPARVALGERIETVAPAATAAQVLRWDRDLLESPAVQEVVETIRTQSGVDSVIHRLRAPIFDEHSAARYVVTVSEDVTRARSAEADLRLASKVFETTADAIVISDDEDRVITVNTAFTAMTGHMADELLGFRLYESVFAPEDMEAANARLARLRAEGCVTAAVKRRHRDGRELDLWLTATIVRDDTGRIVNHIRIFSDISELKSAQRQLERLANFDPLTGLANRRLFEDRLEQAILRAQRTGDGIGLLFLDLDGFKDVNDTWGHGMGDRLLKEAAARLLRCVRASDSLCRLGGDEFTVILENAALREHAVFIARRIHRELTQPVVLDGHRLQLGVSIGIALYPDDGGSATELVSHADAAMYTAKGEGGNRYAFYRARTAEMIG